MTATDAHTIDQVKELFESYVEAGMVNTSSGRFLQSIIAENRMPRGGGQRWLSDLISRGLNKENVKRAAEILSVAESCDRDDIRGELASFSRKIAAGYALTDRQVSYLESIIRQARGESPDVELTPREAELIGVLSVEKRSNVYYWSGRPAISNRIDRIFDRFNREKRVSSEDFDYLKKNMKGITEIFMETGKKHPVGSLRWLRDVPVTVLGDAFFDDSHMSIRVNVMAPTGSVNVSPRELRIRRK